MVLQFKKEAHLDELRMQVVGQENMWSSTSVKTFVGSPAVCRCPTSAGCSRRRQREEAEQPLSIEGFVLWSVWSQVLSAHKHVGGVHPKQKLACRTFLVEAMVPCHD